MKIIAKKLVQQYPQTFQDLDDGYQSILLKLIDRNNYLNRPHKRRSLESECSV